MKTKLLFVVAAIMSCVSVMGQWNKSTETLLSWSEETLDDNVEMELTPNGSVWFFTQNLFSQETSTRLTSCLSMVDSEGNRPLEQAIIVSDYPSKAWIAVGKTLYVDSEGNAIVAVSDRRKGIEEYESYTVYKISPEGEFLWGEDGITLDGENVYSLVSGMSICQLEDSSYIFAWMHNHESNDNLFSIEMQRISAEGEMLWNADDVRLHVDNENYSYPYVVNGGNNQVIMLYAKGTSQDLYARKIDFDGTKVWSEDTRVYNGGWGSIPIWTLMDVHPSGDGGLIVSWNDDRNSTEIESAYMAYVKSDGEIGFTSENGQMLGYAGLRSLDVSSYYDDTSDSFYAIWRESSAGQSSNRVVAQRISKEGELLWGENGLEIEKMNNNYSYSDFSIQSTDDNEIAFFYLQSSSSTEQIPIVATVHTSDTTFRAKSCISNYISNKRNLQSTPAYNDNWLVSWIEDKQLLIQGVSCELPRLTIGDKFTVDGIHYEVLNESGQVAVTYYGEDPYNVSDEYKYAGTVVIPESVTYEGVTYSVTSIGYRAFSDCVDLTSITLPERVTDIGQYAFYGCTGLTEVTIPNSVTSIGSSAFYGCTGLTEVTIPNSVTSIDYGAFYSCSGLTSVIIPNSVTSIGYCAFSGCSGLTEITIPESVTSIGDWAFSHCVGLTSITIPESVTSIGNYAFDSCYGLTSITIPNSVTSIGNYAFDSCHVLTEITIPNSVTSIGNYAFAGNYGLTSITIPESVTSIGDGACCGCTGLTSIKVEEGNTVYDSREGCNAIVETATNTLVAGCKKTIIPNSVTSIGDYAFGACDGLTSITIPEGVTSIGDYAFANCSGLTEITIPESVTSIGHYAFHGCDGLTSIRIEAVNPPAIEESTFSGIDKSIPVYVPAESLEAYQNAAGWSEFTNIVAIGEDDNSLLAEAIEVAKVDGVMKQEEISLPISLINNTAIAGLQCDIFLPDGLTPVMQGDKYDIVLSSRAEGFDVIAKLRNDGALRVVVVSTDTTDSIRAISGNEGELFTIKLKPNEQYSTDDNIAIRNIVMTGSDYAEYEASDVVISCTIKESITGDSNRDKKVNVTDLSQMANYVAGNELGTFDADGADANQDGLVDSADIDAVSDVVVKASKTEAQNNTEVTEATENRLEAEVIEVVKMDGMVVTNPISLPIALTNTATITAIQCDITVPAGLTLVENDDVADITLSERLGESHVVKSAWLDNGALRVLIYSPTAEGVEGESGTLFTLQLQPNESYQADATIEVKNITMASTDAVEYNAMPLGISCTVKESYKGDVNRDGKVNVTDVIVTIGKVLNVYDGEFDTVSADIDQDGEITIVDVVAIINLVLDEGDTPSQARMQDEYAQGALTMQDVKMSQGETKDLVIGLTNEAPYTAFQMDVTLPAGLNIEHIALSERANGHTLQWQVQADGSVRLVGYALDNATIADNDGALLTLTVSSDSQFETGEVMVSNTIFSTRQLVSHRLERMTAKVSNITALNDVVAATRIYATDHKVVVDSPVAQEAAISTIDGVVQRVALQPGRNEIPLQQGVYIVAVDAEVKKVVIR